MKFGSVVHPRAALAGVVCVAALLAPAAGWAAEPVDVALVLVSDVSRSIDDTEFNLQKQGYAAALTDPRVLAAIHDGPLGAIGLTYIEFAGAGEVKDVIDWTIIRDAASAGAFVARLSDLPRSFWGRTSISAGVDRAVQSLGESGLQATRQVIDVCGDGTSNAGRDMRQSRDDALAAGVTINGLAIINDHPASYIFAHVQPPGGLAAWYRDNVTGGPGSFVLEVHDFATFGQAMTRKLLNEIASLPARPSQQAAR